MQYRHVNLSLLLVLLWWRKIFAIFCEVASWARSLDLLLLALLLGRPRGALALLTSLRSIQFAATAHLRTMASGCRSILQAFGRVAIGV